MSQQNIKLSCGLHFSSVGNISDCIKLAFDNRYEFICIPLVHPRLKTEFINNNITRDGPFTRPDIVLQSKEWRTSIVGTISEHINVDSSEETYRKQSEHYLKRELDYANHLDVPAILVPLKSLNCSNLARILYSRIVENAQCHAWVHVPIQHPNLEVSQWRSDLENEIISNESTWEWWNRFHALCSFTKRVGVALELTKSLPCDEELERWFAEPIKCIILCTSLFSTSKNNCPFLPKAHQTFLQKMSRFNIQIVIKGNNQFASFHLYQKYLNYLWQVYDYQPDPLSRLAEGMEESLLVPLQPVTDNLNIGIYESFERDLVKYKEYEKALKAALTDLISSEKKEEKTAKIMVLGATRGRLVNVALTAARKADRKIKIYAVERNPYSNVTLSLFREEHWRDLVEIICKDVREIKDLEKVDIILSELLGSFGDNELAPEILVAAQKFLKAEGISIPESYTSYVFPVQNCKLYNNIKTNKDNNHLEKPYVVFQKHKFSIAASQPLCTFDHPNLQERIDNSRHKSVKFDVKTDCVLHGFSGSFDAVLYKDIVISTVPENFTYGLISWFPIFFPLTRPVHLKAGDEIEFQFWRWVSKTHVWYEWTILKPIMLPIHNRNGTCYEIGLR